MKRDDSLWKAILEDIFDDFLRFFFENAEEIFDISKGFVFMDKELEQLFPSKQDEFNPKYVDKLVKVFKKDGGEEWILIHIEVQGKPDKKFGQRMFTYYYRIFDKYQKPIVAFAILTDNNQQFQVNSFHQELFGTKLHYEFNKYKILDQSDEVLLKSNNPFAMVVLVAKLALQKKRVADEELLNLKIELAKRLFAKQFSKDKIRALMSFLKLYVRFGKQELISKFDKELDIITNKPAETMGIEEFVLKRERRLGERKGIEKGIEKGISMKEKAFVEALISETNFDDKQIAVLAGVSLEFVRNIRLNSKA